MLEKIHFVLKHFFPHFQKFDLFFSQKILACLENKNLNLRFVKSLKKIDEFVSCQKWLIKLQSY